VKDISARQRKIFEYVRDFIDQHDYPPSIRQIQEACSISSTSVVDYNLRILERMGYIKRDREVSRAIEVTHGGTKRARVVTVPIIGAIAAGQPISVPAADTWQAVAEDTIDVSVDMLRNRDEVFGLKVKGTSMIDALVNDGDVVILEQTNTASNGDMVAAWIEDEQATTLKKYYLEGDKVRLQPANETMEPIIKDAAKVQVQGRVLAAFRPMN